MDYQDVRDTIEKLLKAPTNMQNCEKLAALYTVLDHQEVGNRGEYAYDAKRGREAMKSMFTDFEFCQAVNGMSIDEVMTVIDEQMKIMQTTSPSTHEMIIRALMERR